MNDNEPAYISLTEASRRMRGRAGRHPSIQTLRRWANPKRGCWPNGASGKQLLLVTVRIGGEILTTAEWVDAFEKERQRLGQRVAPLVPLPRSERAKTKAHKAAEARLDAAGVRRRTDG